MEGPLRGVDRAKRERRVSDVRVDRSQTVQRDGQQGLAIFAALGHGASGDPEFGRPSRPGAAWRRLSTHQYRLLPDCLILTSVTGRCIVATSKLAKGAAHR
ncbi:MAG TPA: hypothetical protein VFW73_09325 [Lacipirellulaceae bacterium]|nr:hypothetical protein [Lacipirellulaceae bacterium]